MMNVYEFVKVGNFIFPILKEMFSYSFLSCFCLWDEMCAYYKSRRRALKKVWKILKKLQV